MCTRGPGLLNSEIIGTFFSKLVSSVVAVLVSHEPNCDRFSEPLCYGAMALCMDELQQQRTDHMDRSRGQLLAKRK